MKWSGRGERVLLAVLVPRELVRVVLEEKYVAVPNESTRTRMGIETREKRAVEREWAGCVYCAAGGERK